MNDRVTNGAQFGKFNFAVGGVATIDIGNRYQITINNYTY